MTLLGIGGAPVGSSLVGLGLLVESSEVRPRIYTKADGSPGSVALLAPSDDGASDYQLDSRGREIGSDSTPMRVLLALTTAKGSTPIAAFGLDLSLGVFRADTALRVDAAIRSALAELVKQKLISILSVSFLKQDLSALVSVKWLDLKSKELQTTSINVQ